MPRQLPADCLNEIFEYLEQDSASLHSCLLVNRLWCEVSVRILWRDIFGSKYIVPTHESSLLSIVIACLPRESKDLLHKNEIFIQEPTSKPPLFNYTAFCQVISIWKITNMIDSVLKNQQIITSLSSEYNIYLMTQEFIKMFMAQITSLKSFIYYLDVNIFNINFTFPGASDCLTHLSELNCSSDIYPEFLFQLSQICCHNLQSLIIEFQDHISKGLTDFISLQKNLKHLTLRDYESGVNFGEIIPSLVQLSETLIKLDIDIENEYYKPPISFITEFKNLQELNLEIVDIEGFNELQYVTFPNLQILNILNLTFYQLKPEYIEYIANFLQYSGKNIKELKMKISTNPLISSVAQFCPNVRKLFISFYNNELDLLKAIFNGCQYLESLKIWYYKEENNVNYEKELFEIVAKYSPKTFGELELYNYYKSEVLSENLGYFFMCWKDRVPKKSLTLNIIKDERNIDVNEKSMKIIEDYRNLGFIRKFKNGALEF